MFLKVYRLLTAPGKDPLCQPPYAHLHNLGTKPAGRGNRLAVHLRKGWCVCKSALPTAEGWLDAPRCCLQLLGGTVGW